MRRCAPAAAHATGDPNAPKPVTPERGRRTPCCAGARQRGQPGWCRERAAAGARAPEAWSTEHVLRRAACELARARHAPDAQSEGAGQLLAWACVSGEPLPRAAGKFLSLPQRCSAWPRRRCSGGRRTCAAAWPRLRCSRRAKPATRRACAPSSRAPAARRSSTPRTWHTCVPTRVLRSTAPRHCSPAACCVPLLAHSAVWVHAAALRGRGGSRRGGQGADRVGRGCTSHRRGACAARAARGVARTAFPRSHAAVRFSRLAAEARRQGGWTALHWTAERGHSAVASQLLAAGADARAANRVGVTPLHSAAEKNAATVAALLLRAGADPRAANAVGDTPLHWCALAAASAFVAAAFQSPARAHAPHPLLQGGGEGPRRAGGNAACGGRAAVAGQQVRVHAAARGCGGWPRARRGGAADRGRGPGRTRHGAWRGG